MSVQVYHIFLSGRKSILICRQGGTQFIAPSHVYHRPRRGMHMGTTAGTTRGRGPPRTSAPTMCDVPVPCATCPGRARRARAMCDVPVPNVSRPGLHGRARAAMGEGYGREKKSTMRAVLSGSTPWGWWPKSARFSTSTFPPAALRRAAKGSQFSAGRTVWSCPP